MSLYEWQGLTLPLPEPIYHVQLKQNTIQPLTPEMVDYCKEHPTSDLIPAYVTGHDTVYEWCCKDGTPRIVKQLFK